VRWETAAEYLNAGFNLYRLDDTGGAHRMNVFPIPAKGTETQGATYSFTDHEAMGPGETRTYQWEDVEFSGKRTLHGPVTVGLLETAASAVGDWSLFGW